VCHYIKSWHSRRGCVEKVSRRVSESVWQQLFAAQKRSTSITSSFRREAPAAFSIRSGLLPLKMIAYLPLLRHQNIPLRISIHPSSSAAKLLLFNRSAETIPTSWSFYSPQATLGTLRSQCWCFGGAMSVFAAALRRARAADGKNMHD
jgi:hypothetical protein